MIIPVILESDIDSANQKIKSLKGVAPLVQVDIADGKLVTGSTFTGMDNLERLLPDTALELHLMVNDPFPYITRQLNSVESICTQIECLDHNKNRILEFLTKAKRLGYRVGISLAPETSVEEIEPLANIINYVQFVSVEPGHKGYPFIPETYKKIEHFRELYPDIPLQIDGGVKEDIIPRLLQLGVNNVVIGSAIFDSIEPDRTYLNLSKENFMADQHNTITSLTDTHKRINKISFLGGASWQESDEVYKQAFEVAKILAQNGYEIVNGGGPGVMRAATKGAHAGGAKVLAITYHPNKVKKNYEGTDPLNDFDEEVITLDYFDRTKVLLQNSDLHVVFNGATGTISEFGMTWASSRIHEGNNKPIVLFGAFWNEILDEVGKHMILRPGERELLKVCTTPEEVLEYAKSFN